eukprot:COSAG05_NODE_3935_length_1766_cov_5907.283143_2_plen_172_part_00
MLRGWRPAAASPTGLQQRQREWRGGGGRIRFRTGDDDDGDSQTGVQTGRHIGRDRPTDRHARTEKDRKAGRQTRQKGVQARTGSSYLPWMPLAYPWGIQVGYTEAGRGGGGGHLFLARLGSHGMRPTSVSAAAHAPAAAPTPPPPRARPPSRPARASPQLSISLVDDPCMH